MEKKVSGDIEMLAACSALGSGTVMFLTGAMFHQPQDEAEPTL